VHLLLPAGLIFLLPLPPPPSLLSPAAVSLSINNTLILSPRLRLHVDQNQNHYLHSRRCWRRCSRRDHDRSLHRQICTSASAQLPRLALMHFIAPVSLWIRFMASLSQNPIQRVAVLLSS
jgi:hypothetical protein